MVLFNTIGISWPVAWKSINDMDCEHFHKEMYRNDPKFLDRQVSASSADPDQTAPPQGLHCLPFRLHLFDTVLYRKTTVFKF